MPKIGAHVSAAVSLERAFDKASEIGAECFQFFISPPRQWNKTNHNDEEIERFLDQGLRTQIGPNFIHSTYLVNLGTPNTEHLEKSIEWLIYALNMASKLNVQGIIVHTGSYRKETFTSVLTQVSESIKRIFDKVPEGPHLILETSAGGGGSIGKSFSELGQIIKKVNNGRVHVCLDTQHVFASGYDIKSALGLKEGLEEFENEIGLNNLKVIHANDSKTEFNSKRDRHENIGEGFIGKEGFKNLLANPALKEIPFILEVPGLSGNGPDKENVDILKKIREVTFK